ncbi:developmentally Regulated MAPK Interacting protein [Schizosaccharomyces cryophilus OY26]|uniref:Developmentally Regulated MAPK Interacting protein n=1 Tax=Schizosaccharomyces cryophilus (strain OY26 / ATCC MYA-4695 / CBS 11777 / NBRC 106824 / NRRL Y48691) TaxID=653667 RepID=S9W2B8_SCHCR|nr:developmentally Regulated MAPK Interacting protein [Schizosaccharomyces cryophilus OY26]EPY52529.1 developmentally Regulated MAPK Interacting protein [Schizosaccharomyces cryophilus OY26]
MMLPKVASFAFIAYSMAIQINIPSPFEEWKTGEEHTVKWNFVDEDPKVAQLYLSNYIRYPPINKFITTLSVPDGSYTIDTTDWPIDGGYRINMRSPENFDEIYAQSEEFILTPPRD